MLQRAGIVVQHYGTRIHVAEGVEQVAHTVLLGNALRCQPRSLLKAALTQQGVVARGPECQVVADQWMHPVDSDEFFGNCIGHAEMVPWPARDTADYLALADPAEQSVDALAKDPPPVRPHTDLQRRMTEDTGRPLHSVDLGEQCGVH